MFNSKKSTEPSSKNRLFQVALHISRGTNQDMPVNLVGAYVPIFVAAKDHEEAAMKAVSHMTQQGFVFVDIPDGKLHEIDHQKWESFVRIAWADHINQFPTQSEVIEQLDTEFFFVGPFACYEAGQNIQPGMQTKQ